MTEYRFPFREFGLIRRIPRLNEKEFVHGFFLMLGTERGTVQYSFIPLNVATCNSTIPAEDPLLRSTLYCTVGTDSE